MPDRIARKLSYANVVASIALFVALGGSSYAAVELAKGSVKRNHLAADAVASSKVEDGSLRLVDFKKDQFPTGPKGDRGARGPEGETGGKGDKGDPGLAPSVVRSTSVVTRNGESGAASVTCKVGERVTGGGAELLNGNIENFRFNGDNPIVTEAGAILGWEDSVVNRSGQDNTWRVYVLCAGP